MMGIEAAKKFAVKNGWGKATYIKDWNGYRVYELGNNKKNADDDTISCVGYPLVLLENDKELRISTPKESLDFMLHSCKDDDF